MRGLITRGDYSIMHRANNWVAPRWVRFYVLGATRGGDGWLWYAMGLAILLFGGEQRFAALGAAGLSSVLSIVLFIWLKRFTGRRRPTLAVLSGPDHRTVLLRAQHRNVPHPAGHAFPE